MADKSRIFLVKSGSTTYRVPRLRFANGSLAFTAGEAVYTAPSGVGSSPLTTNGDLYYHNAGDARLPIGANGRILMVVSGFPAWSIASDVRTQLALVPGTDIMAYDADLADIAGLAPSRGDILVRNSSAWTRLPIGAANRLLLSDGTDPAWASPADVRTALDLATYYQPIDADLTALAGLGDGIPVRSGGAWSASAADAVVSDAAGANGLVTRTSSGSVTARTITAGSGVSVSNGDGVSGNPTITVSGGTNSDMNAAVGRWWQVSPSGAGIVFEGTTAALSSAGSDGSDVDYPWVTCSTSSAKTISTTINVRTSHNGTFWCRFKINDTSNVRYLITIGSASGTGVIPAAHACGVWWDSALHTNWQAFSTDTPNTNRTDSDLGMAPATGKIYLCKVVLSGTSIVITLYNKTDVTEATATITTNLPSTAQNIGMFFSVVSTSGTRKVYFGGASYNALYAV